MTKIKTILVPVDFSTNGNNALRYALKLNETLKCKLVVFHSNYVPYTLPSNEIKQIYEQSEGRKELMLHYVVDSICKKNKIKKPQNISYIVKRETDVTKNIISAAESAKANLIVMGTHGATGVKKLLMGSNTAGVIEKSTIPVLTIPMRFRYKKIDTIVYASDVKNVSEELKSVIPFAEIYNSKIEILYLDYWKKGLTEAEQKNLELATTKSNYKKIKYIHKDVKINKTLQEHIESYVKKQKNSILVMFPENLNFFEKIFFASVTKKLSYNFSRPMLSIRKK